LTFGSLPFENIAPGTALVWTADDAEQRLLAGLPAPLGFLAACGAWTLGAAVSIDRPWQHPSEWIARIRRLQFAPAPETADRNSSRPALSPTYQTLPSWIAEAFQTWRSETRIQSAVELTALEAGVRQLHDDLDGSHQCAQSIEGAGRHHGDYWHAVMHRREPDYGNSQYWFRRVGRHPVFVPLAEEAHAVAAQFSSDRFTAWLPKLVSGGMWNPLAGVDCVAEAADSSEAAFRRAVEELQYRELLLLLAQTCRDAV
jgi:hypothetical protein